MDALQLLLDNHLLPLQEKVSATRQYVTKEYKHEIEFDELVSILLRNVGSVLLEIYYVYFQHEVRGSESEEKTKKQDEKQIFELLREFDICPTLINKGVAYKIFLQSYDNPIPTYQSTCIELVENSGQ